MITLDALAAMDATTFVDTLGSVFEHSPWVAEAAYARRPYASEDALHETMMQVVRDAPVPQQVAFLNIHPELAGREAEAGTMTDDSTFEQKRAGLDALTNEELQTLRELNARYRERHGFPFIIAVMSHDKAAIFSALRERIEHDSKRELQEAMNQVASITRRRLHTLLAA